MSETYLLLQTTHVETVGKNGAGGEFSGKPHLPHQLLCIHTWQRKNLPYASPFNMTAAWLHMCVCGSVCLRVDGSGKGRGYSDRCREQVPDVMWRDRAVSHPSPRRAPLPNLQSPKRLPIYNPSTAVPQPQVIHPIDRRGNLCLHLGLYSAPKPYGRTNAAL